MGFYGGFWEFFLLGMVKVKVAGYRLEARRYDGAEKVAGYQPTQVWREGHWTRKHYYRFYPRILNILVSLVKN